MEMNCNTIAVRLKDRRPNHRFRKMAGEAIGRVTIRKKGFQGRTSFGVVSKGFVPPPMRGPSIG